MHDYMNFATFQFYDACLIDQWKSPYGQDYNKIFD